MTTVRFEQDHGVGTIVLANSPSNRIGSQFAVDLRAAVHDASLSDSRVLVIRSDGPNFCMGGNVPEWPGKSADWFRTFIAECNSSFHAIEALRIPTVAVVRGGAIGGGFELALACDFLVAAEDATFFAVEIRSGNIPLAGGLQRLAERVGRARALKLALLGEPFSGIIAGDLGIATLVVPEADLDQTSRKLVDKLANGPTKAYAAARTILKAWSAGGVAAADVMMLDVAIDLFRTEDTTKGILNSAKAIQAGVQPSPLTFLGR
jgi:enoyl-CoA hydratase/carnithine racemase